MCSRVSVRPAVWPAMGCWRVLHRAGRLRVLARSGAALRAAPSSSTRHRGRGCDRGRDQSSRRCLPASAGGVCRVVVKFGFALHVRTWIFPRSAALRPFWLSSATSANSPLKHGACERRWPAGRGRCALCCPFSRDGFSEPFQESFELGHSFPELPELLGSFFPLGVDS